MSRQVLAPPRTSAWSSAVKPAVPALALGLLAFGLMFHTEVVAAVGVWISSTAYNHCFLVIPIVAYLIWDRREVLVGAAPRPAPWVAIAALPIGAVWFLADRVGIMEGRQLAAMALVELLFLAVLGWRLYYVLLGPLLYLFFLVPFGAFITPVLQDITTAFTTHGLDLLGIPNYTDAYTIEIPEGTFYIAEACAGLRFLIAAIAFGCLYALLMYRSWPRRLIFILISMVVPVIANGFRALGIVVLGHLLGSAQAAATDHVLYGWIFFSIVILLLVVLGLPFREDNYERVPLAWSARERTTSPRTLFSAAAAVFVLAFIGPLIAALFDRASAAELPAQWPLLPLGGCTEIAPAEQMISNAPGRVVVQHLHCSGGGVVVRTEIFSPRSDPGVVIGEQRRLLALTGDLDGSKTVVVHGVRWRLMQTEEPLSGAAALWMSGLQGGGLRQRLIQARASVLGGSAAPVALAVLPDPDPSAGPNGSQRAEQAIMGYLQAQPELASEIRRISGLTPAHK
jgi:exosortase A